MNNQKDKEWKLPGKLSKEGMENLGLRVKALNEVGAETGTTTSGKTVSGTSGGSTSEGGAFVVRIAVNNLNDFMKNFKNLELRIEKCEGMAMTASGTSAGGTIGGEASEDEEELDKEMEEEGGIAAWRTAEDEEQLDEDMEGEAEFAEDIEKK